MMAEEDYSGISQRFHAVVKAARSLSMEPIPEIAIGIASTPDIQAKAIAVGDTYLVVVYTGLLEFAAQAVNLIAGARPGTLQGVVQNPVVGIVEAKESFKNLINYFLTGKQGFVPPFNLDGERLSFAGVIFSRLVDFVIAHEVAHILCGHFTNSSPSKALNTGNNFNRRSIEDEFEADTTAFRIVQRLYEIEASRPFSLESFYTAPIIFFQLVHVLRRVKGNILITSHPHPTTRQSNIVSTAPSDGPQSFPNLEALVGTIEILLGTYPDDQKERTDQLNKADKLFAYAQKCDATELDELIDAAKVERGMKSFELRSLIAYMSHSEEKARAAAAIAALGYFTSGVGTRGFLRINFGILYGLYISIYQIKDDEFKFFIEECFVDLDEVLQEVRAGLVATGSSPPQ